MKEPQKGLFYLGTGNNCKGASWSSTGRKVSAISTLSSWPCGESVDAEFFPFPFFNGKAKDRIARQQQKCFWTPPHHHKWSSCQFGHRNLCILLELPFSSTSWRLTELLPKRSTDQAPGLQRKPGRWMCVSCQFHPQLVLPWEVPVCGEDGKKNKPNLHFCPLKVSWVTEDEHQTL